MKRIHSIYISVFFVLMILISYGQNKSSQKDEFHLIYVETSQTRNKTGTAKLISGILNDIDQKNDSFVVLVSNRNSSELINDADQIKYISNLINDQNIVLPSAVNDREKLLEYFDEHDIITQTKDDRVLLNYSNLNIYLFQSVTFTTSFSNELLFKFLKIKNISSSDKNSDKVNIKVYLDKSSERFNTNINEISSQFSNREKEYNYEFIVY